MRKILFLITLIGLWSFEWVLFASDNVIFNEDFQQQSPVEFWTASVKYKINFMGLTTENAQPKRKVFKLDLTFENDAWGHCYFKIPCDFVPKKDIRIKARMLIGKESTANVSIGLNLLYPIIGKSACSPIQKPFDTTGNKWLDVDWDVTPWFCKHDNDIINKYGGLAQPVNLTPKADSLAIFTFGRNKNNRLVLYFELLSVTGETYPLDQYKDVQSKRWQPVIDRQKTILEEFKQALTSYEQSAGRNTVMGKVSAELFAKLEKSMQNEGNQFVITPDDYKMLQGNMADMQTVSSARGNRKAIVYVLNNPIISDKVLPDAPVPSAIKAKNEGDIKVIAAKSESESFSIIVKALQTLKGLTLTCDTLKQINGKNIISEKNIDIKIVKCWYQSGSAWMNPFQTDSRILVPELLLNDDSLVKVDDAQKTNYLKLQFTDQCKYWNVDDKKYNRKEDIKTVLPVADFPFYDSPKLLPCELEAGRVKQFWITIKVSQTASPGIYTGNLKVSDCDNTLANFSLKLRVLPFELPKPATRYNTGLEYVSSIYYRSVYDLKYPNGTLTSEWRSLEQIAAELKNMREHNIYNPNCRQSFKDDGILLGKMLELRNASGMEGLPVYYMGFVTEHILAQKKEELTSSLNKISALMNKYGVPKFYCYGLDEAEGEKLRKQFEIWKNIRSCGVGIFAAGEMKNFKDSATALDIQVLSGNPERTKAEQWHKQNTNIQLFAYACPQGGVEDPELNRRGLGLLPWLANYDGVMTYAYMHSMGNGWNDWDNEKYREHNYVYPTTDGVISTLALAGYREGIDDIRYATLLMQLIRNNQNQNKASIAEEAKKYMDALTSEGDLQLARMEMIKYILKLLE